MITGIKSMFYVIVNPTSNSGNGADIWKKTEEILKREGITYRLYETSKTVSAKGLAAQIPCSVTDTLIVIGGDGTLNEVFNGIKDFSKVTLGYIPAGTGGDFARDLGISKDPMKALHTILNPKQYKMMDIGRLENQEVTKNFVVSCGIGFDAAVAIAVGNSKLKNYLSKIKLASLSYTLIAVKMILGAKRKSCTVILDEEREIHYDNFIFAAPMIHRYEGGGFMFCPAAECDDGMLDICVAGDIKKFRVFYIIPTAYKGKHLKFKGIDIYKAKKVRIISERPESMHTDGEYAGVQTEMTASIYEEKVRVIIN